MSRAALASLSAPPPWVEAGANGTKTLHSTGVLIDFLGLERKKIKKTERPLSAVVKQFLG